MHYSGWQCWRLALSPHPELSNFCVDASSFSVSTILCCYSCIAYLSFILFHLITFFLFSVEHWLCIFEWTSSAKEKNVSFRNLGIWQQLKAYLKGNVQFNINQYFWVICSKDLNKEDKLWTSIWRTKYLLNDH